MDINGDGRSDYVKVKDDSNLGIHLSLGSRFGSEITANVVNVFRDFGEEKSQDSF